jgi:mycothiol maleylpyruvate isomerase-like protein
VSLREELADREAREWSAFAQRVRADEGLAFGWSSSEVAGHLAFWMDRCAAMLEATAAGPVEDGAFEVDIDAENDARKRGWAATPPDEAIAAMEAARARLLAAWAAIDDPDGTAAAWFAEDSFEHYDEHMEATDGS